MNRIIKFRVWDTHLLKFRDLAIAWNPNTNENYGIDGEEGHYPVSKGYIIQEFTGLLDFHGKEIYEGDILEYSTIHDDTPKQLYRRQPAEIIFNNGCFKIGPWTLQSLIKLEIKGNIFQNKELLNYETN